MFKMLMLSVMLFFIVACGEETKIEKNNKVIQKFSCEESKKEIDEILKKYETGEMPEQEYWELRQIEYNEKCEKTYNIG